MSTSQQGKNDNESTTGVCLLFDGSALSSVSYNHKKHRVDTIVITEATMDVLSEKMKFLKLTNSNLDTCKIGSWLN